MWWWWIFVWLGGGSRKPLSGNCSPQIFARVLSQPSKTPLYLHLFTHLSHIILNFKIIFWNVFSLSANSQIIDLLRNRRVRERVERPTPCRVRRWGCRHATANQLTAQTSCYETSGPAQLCKWPNHSRLAVRKRCFSRLMTNLVPTQTLYLYSSNCTVLLGTSRLGLYVTVRFRLRVFFLREFTLVIRGIWRAQL